MGNKKTNSLEIVLSLCIMCAHSEITKKTKKHHESNPSSII